MALRRCAFRAAKVAPAMGSTQLTAHTARTPSLPAVRSRPPFAAAAALSTAARARLPVPVGRTAGTAFPPTPSGSMHTTEVPPLCGASILSLELPSERFHCTTGSNGSTPIE